MNNLIDMSGFINTLYFLQKLNSPSLLSKIPKVDLNESTLLKPKGISTNISPINIKGAAKEYARKVVNRAYNKAYNQPIEKLNNLTKDTYQSKTNSWEDINKVKTNVNPLEFNVISHKDFSPEKGKNPFKLKLNGPLPISSIVSSIDYLQKKNANNRIKDILLQGRAPLMIAPTEIGHSSYTDVYGLNAAYKQASDIRSRFARNNATTSADRNLLTSLAAEEMARDAENQGNYTYGQSVMRDRLMNEQRLTQAAQMRAEVANRNDASIAELANRNNQIRAQHTNSASNNFSTYLRDLLAQGKEYIGAKQTIKSQEDLLNLKAKHMEESMNDNMSSKLTQKRLDALSARALQEGKSLSDYPEYSKLYSEMLGYNKKAALRNLEEMRLQGKNSRPWIL